MILRQFLHTSPTVAASYLFGCGGKQAGAVVDPIEPPAFYIKKAEEVGLRILFVVDTHVHADHISTGRELAETTGATYLLHEASGASMPHRAVRDGEHIELGNVLVEVLHMPGHTPEHIALLVTDRARANEPWFVFTGHALMVGDMGRTELATSAADGARAMFATAQRFAALPDHIEVLPGAFAGSVCGRGLSGKASSTIGFERRFNRAFRVTHLEPFVHLMLLDIPAPPPNAAEVRRLNLGVADQLSRVAS